MNDQPQEQQTEQPKLNWKYQVFERRLKAKITVLALLLVTISYYAVLILRLDIEHFTYYAGFISLLVAGYTGADVANTRAFLKKGDSSS